MNISELKQLLSDAFQKGNETYIGLKEEYVEKTIENYLKSKPNNDQITVGNYLPNSNPSYYSYFADGLSSITLGQGVTTTTNLNTEEII